MWSTLIGFVCGFLLLILENVSEVVQNVYALYKYQTTMSRLM